VPSLSTIFVRLPYRDSRLSRRLSQIDKLPAKERKQIVQLLDTYLEREKLRKPPQQLKTANGR